MANRGLLLTMTEPPPAMEEEFNAWYDTEHMQERLGITGFRSARRWVADVPAGAGKYLATYELDSAQVLTSGEYLSKFENQTPWSRRCLGKAVVFRRWACEQAGTADPHPMAKALLMVASDSPVAGLSVPGGLQTRFFAASAGTPRHVALIELAWDGAPSMPAPQPGWFMRLYRAYAA